MPDPSPLEDLATECFARLEAEGPAALDALCAAHPAQARALRKIVAELARFGLDGPVRSADDLRTLGEYRILGRLGCGGMGVVYLAEQPRLHRRVALKVLRQGMLVNSRSRERFRREAAALARLNHPNLCSVYDAGEIEGTPYLAMPVVDGPSLAEVLAPALPETAGRAPRAGTSTKHGKRGELLILLEKVARALHAAHEVGVVHRDIKPGNVLIDRSGEPVVMDFGLVHEVDPQTTLTRSGDLLGTPSYMAPEQIEPTLGPVDRRTDVYALGVMAFECLTRLQPYVAPTRDALYRRILDGDAAEPRELDRSIATEVSLVVRRAMNRHPAERFATAADFADELERCRTHQPIHTRRLAWRRRLWRWSQRNTVAAVFLITFGCGLLLSLLLSAALARTLRERDAALQVVAIRAAAEKSPERAFVQARELLRAQPSPTHASLVQELMGELHAEAIVPIDGPGQQFALSPDGRSFVTMNQDQRPVLRRFATADSALCANVQIRGAAAVTFGPTGEQLAIGTTSGHVLIVDTKQLVTRQTLATFAEASSCASVSWRHGTLLGVFAGKGWCTWDRHFNPSAVVEKKEFNASIGALAPYGDWAVIGEMARLEASTKLVVHDLEAGRQLEIPDLPGNCQALDVCVSSFAAALTGGVLLLGKRHGGEPLRIPTTGSVPSCVAFAPNGTRLLCGDFAGALEVRNEDGVLLDRVQLGATVTRVAFSRDGQRVAAACWDHTIRVFDLEPGDRLAEVAVLRGHGNGVGWLEFDPTDADRLVSCSAEGCVRSWRVQSRAVPVGVSHARGAFGIAALADDHVLSTAAAGEIRVSDAALVPVRRTSALELRSTNPNQPRVSPDAEEVAINSAGGRALAWRWRQEPVPALLPARSELVNLPVEALGNGRYATIVSLGNREHLATAGGGGNQWKPWHSFPETPTHVDGVYYFRMAPAHDRLLTIDGRFVLRVWELGAAGLQLLRERPSGRNRFGGTFSADLRFVFQGSETGLVQRWDLETDTKVEFSGHEGHVRQLALSPDGRHLLTASSDKTLRLWDAQTGVELMVLRGHKKNVMDCCFTRDGSHALSSSRDGTIRRWWLSTEAILRAADAVDASVGPQAYR